MLRASTSSGIQQPGSLLTDLVTPAGFISSQFAYIDDVEYLDERLARRFRPCADAWAHGLTTMTFQPSSGASSHFDSEAIGYHLGCLTLAPFEPSLPFLRATEYSFEPCESEKRRRRDWIQRALAVKLMKTWARLPLEIWWAVARLLARECATSTITETWLAHRSSSCFIDVSSSLWARYILIEGVFYVADLSNSPSHGSGCIQIFDASKMPPADTLYVLDDHLGIRQILFARSDNPAKLPTLDTKPGLWWRTISISSHKFQAKSDVSIYGTLLHV